MLAFCLLNKIPHEVVETRIFRLEHTTEEFRKINPFMKVPAIVHNDFCLDESHAILRYLCSVFPVKNYLYPKDP